MDSLMSWLREDVVKDYSLLGHQYTTTLNSLVDVIAQIPHLTYRKGFPPIGGDVSSDSGWGCTYRAAQMALAEALQRIHGHGQALSAPVRQHILAMFFDEPKRPYSIHKMVQATRRPVGTWLTPAQAAHTLGELTAHRGLGAELRVRVITGLFDPWDLAAHAGDPFVPLLIFAPLSLGTTKIEPRFYEPIRRFFQVPWCVGAVGGKPQKAFYFIGMADDRLLYLDPHTTQSALLQTTYSFQCCRSRKPSTTHISKLDGTFCPAFLVSSQEQLYRLVEYMYERQKAGQRLCEVHPHRTQDYLQSCSPVRVTQPGLEMEDSYVVVPERDRDRDRLSARAHCREKSHERDSRGVGVMGAADSDDEWVLVSEGEEDQAGDDWRQRRADVSSGCVTPTNGLPASHHDDASISTQWVEVDADGGVKDVSDSCSKASPDPCGATSPRAQRAESIASLSISGTTQAPALLELDPALTVRILSTPADDTSSPTRNSHNDIELQDLSVSTPSSSAYQRHPTVRKSYAFDA
eukprot:m.16543 g.16543  ORF g.16543 m.16543 type:complete len:520 (+) comp7109_c0_seq1:163-1722(+)